MTTLALTSAQLAEFLRNGKRTTEVIQRTNEFLQAVRDDLGQSLPGFRASTGIAEQGTSDKNEIQYLNRAAISLAKNLSDGSGKNGGVLELSVFLLPGRLWWGLHSWGARAYIERLGHTVRELNLVWQDDLIDEGNGALGAQEAWPSGAHFALGHEMGPDAVAAEQDLAVFCKRIAEDLVQLHVRFAPHLGDLHQALRTSNGDAMPTEVRKLIEQSLPDPEIRKQYLNLFADTIVEANRIAPNNWGVSMYNGAIRLNVGGVIVWTLSRSGPKDRPAVQVWLVVDSHGLSVEGQKVLDGGKKWEKPDYPIPGAAAYYLDTKGLIAGWPVLREAAWGFLRKATLTTKEFRKPSRKAYAPEVIAYLRQELGRSLPEPAYRNTAQEDGPVDVLPMLRGALAAEGFHFTDWQLATFYTALQTKGFVILSGISGTGKTKIAQHFASLLPQPAVEFVPSDDQIVITVRPYMSRYHRIIIPKQYYPLFDPPQPGQRTEVTVAFEGQEEKCTLTHWHASATDFVQLRMKSKVSRWFEANFKDGDQILMDPTADDKGELVGFALRRPSVASAGKPIPGNGPRNLRFIPVRPDWRDSKGLLGYYNPLTGTYEWTPFLRFLIAADRSYQARDGLAWLVLLDEMNLAHVEYYFADLLSVLESGRDDENGQTMEGLQFNYPDDAEGDLPPRDLRLPPNLYIIGTVNVDETTHAFSPKVLDRAFTIELTDADFTGYPADVVEAASGLTDADRRALLQAFTRDGAFACIDKARIRDFVNRHPGVRDRLQRLNGSLRAHDMHFGYRVFDEIVSFLHAAEDNGLYAEIEGPDTAFDAAVLTKVLPKFHGVRGRLEGPLTDLLAWCVNPDNPEPQTIKTSLAKVESDEEEWSRLLHIDCSLRHTRDKAVRLLRALYATGFAAFG